MRKYILLFVAILFATASASAQYDNRTELDNGLILNVYNGYGFVESGAKCEGNIVIPNQMEYYDDWAERYYKADITSIDPSCFKDNVKLTGITTNVSMGTIGEYAFQGCAKLKNVNLNRDYLFSIGKYAFAGCTSLERIVLPDGVPTISDYLFDGCSNLAVVKVPTGLTSTVGINSFAFRNCYKLHVIYNFSSQSVNFSSSSTIKPIIIKTRYVIHNGYNDITSYASNDEAVAKLESAEYKDANALYYNFGSTSGAGMESITNGAWDAANGWQANNIVLVDKKPIFAPFDIEARQITYTRDVYEGIWQPLYLPFAMDYIDWCNDCDIAYLYNVHLPNDNGNIVLEFHTLTEGSTVPNVPYLFKPKAGKTSITFKGTTLTATPSTEGSVYCQSTTERFTLRGVYEVKEGLSAMGAYAMGPNGIFVLAKTDDQTLAPFRFYLTIDQLDGPFSSGQTHNMPQRIITAVDGEELDGIDGIEADAFDGQQPAYDMLGRKTAEPQQGLYIKGGKKVIMK